MDMWFYFGEFIHFPRYHRLQPTYAGERLMWILPGAILSRLFSPIYGLLALHLLFYWISVFSAYFLIKTFKDSRTAMLTACLLGCHPLFLRSNGWAYIDSASTAYFLLTLVFIVKARSSRFSRWWLFLAGVSWASLVLTYIIWLSLTPCFVWFYYMTKHEDILVSVKALRDRLVVFLTFFLLGGASLIGCLQIIYTALCGTRAGFFFRNNIVTAFFIIGRNNQPNSSGNLDWIWSAGWIVFPMLVFLLAIGLLMQNSRGAIRLSSVARASIHIYLYVLAVTVIMTIWPVRLLEFDYFASILIAPLFLAMGTTIFQVPASWTDAWFYSLLVICCAVCTLPLWRPNLYQIVGLHSLAPIYAIGVLMTAVCILSPATRLSWVTLMCVFPIVSFALFPFEPGDAWHLEYDGMGLMRRVVSARMAIDRRLPIDAYPAFWLDADKYESRGIMCMTLSHMSSMTHYPEIQANRTYQPGTFLVLITAKKDVFDAANQKMTNAGMPLAYYGQDLVSGGEASYWLTYARVLKRASIAYDSSVLPSPRIVSVAVGDDGWPKTLRLGSQTSEQVSLVGPATRQLFRSNMDSETDWYVARYGRSGGLSIQPNCLFVGDRCGLYTSVDARDYLASHFVVLPAAKPALVFFSIWIKPLQGNGTFRVFIQNEGYDVLAEGREVAARNDGWKLYGELYGDWLDVPDAQELRLVVRDSGGSPLLLDKAELVEVTTDLPKARPQEEKHQ